MSLGKKLIIVHQTPLVDDHGNVYYYSEVEIEEFTRLLTEFSKLIKVAKKITVTALDDLGICSDLQGVERIICILDVLANAISITFRRYFIVPLIPPSADGKSYAEMPTHNDLIYLWAIAKSGEHKNVINVLEKLVEEYNIKELRRYASKLFAEPMSEFFGLTPLSEEDAMKRLKLLLLLPADTRPGCSMSKLIPHLLTVAGLAHVIYISKKGLGTSLSVSDKLNLVILRLAALLHDIGKPITWHRLLLGERPSHTKISVELIEKIFIDKNIIDKYGLSEVYEVLKTIIEYHHVRDISDIPENKRYFRISEININVCELIETLRTADITSSGLDRLGEIFANISKDLIEDLAKERGLTVEDVFIKSGEEVFSFWQSLPDEKLIGIVKSITSRVGSYLIPPDLLKCDEWDVIRDAKVLVLDIAGIQRFIRRESLRILTSASTLIDLVTVFAIPKVFMEILGLTLDCIVYAGGGFAILFVPSHVEEKDVERALTKIREFLGPKISIGVNYAITEINRSWPCTLRNAMARLAVKKSVLRDSRPSIATGYEVMCEWCARRIATKVHLNEYICDECYKLHELGSMMYVKHKLSILEESGYSTVKEMLRDDKNIHMIYQYLMEWLAGVEIEDIPRIRRNIALTKIDGNAVGLFMASAINITEAMCRSIRVDMGMKMGIIITFNRILNFFTHRDGKNKAESIVTRLYVGLLYSGGDDMMAVWPSFISIPTVLSIAKVFWKIVGGAVSLSISIVSAKPKHNIWNLVDALDYLLSECKKIFRLRPYNSLGPKLIAVVSLIKGMQQLFKAEVMSTLGKYRSLGVAYQPLLLLADTTSQDLANLVCNDISFLTSKLFAKVIDTTTATTTDIDTVITKLFELVENPNIQRISTAIHEIFDVVQTHGMNKTILSLYLARASQRESDRIMLNILKGLAELCIICPSPPHLEGRGIAPLFDIYHITEIYEVK